METVNKKIKTIDDEILGLADFNDLIVGAYNDGTAENELPADLSVARSLVPAGTGGLRDFSYIAPEIPILDPEAPDWTRRGSSRRGTV